MGADAGVRLRFGILSTEIELLRGGSGSSLSFIFFFPLSLSFYFRLRTSIRDAAARRFLSLRKVLFPDRTILFYEWRLNSWYETNASGRPCPGKGRPPWDRDRRRNIDEDKK